MRDKQFNNYRNEKENMNRNRKKTAKLFRNERGARHVFGFIINTFRKTVNNDQNFQLLPQYTPDLAPCDFFLIPQLKLPLHRTVYESIKGCKIMSSKGYKSVCVIVLREYFFRLLKLYAKYSSVCKTSNNELYASYSVKLH